ncbi:MAG: biopolymer transporter ExbD [Saprospiraceae bacterium]|nr:biopolymer transporter ExbD [Saprospiraceae bacterium]
MGKKNSRNRMNNEINAGSMADIAFLLLIFFLVTTVIAEDKGVLVKLPPWSDEPPPELTINTRNVYSVLVNAQNQLLVRNEPMEISKLKDNTILFITNPQKRADLSEDPTKALVSLKNDRGTEYKTYLAVYNELKAAYNQIWEEESLKRFSRPYEELSKTQKDEISAAYPLVISEAEPTKFGEEN